MPQGIENIMKSRSMAREQARGPLPTRRSRHTAKELQIANTQAIAKICNTFALG